MSSIIALLKKGRLLPGLQEVPFVAQLVKDVLNHTCYLVKLGEECDEIGMGRRVVSLLSFPKVTPSYPMMWFEGAAFASLGISEKVALQLFRWDLFDLWGIHAEARYLCCGVFWKESGGYIFPCGRNVFTLTADGIIIPRSDMPEAFGQALKTPVFPVTANSDVLSPMYAVVFHALGKLNAVGALSIHQDGSGGCSGTCHIEPKKASLWHEIKVRSSLRVREQILADIEAGKVKSLMRHTPIRGHYADYRENGLFGKPALRGVYWIPEHYRGDPSYGESVPEYVMA
jgi:hypothetical protein